MNDKSFDDFLKQSLRNSSGYVEDEDFTARVMASLPESRRMRPWLEKLIVALPATIIAFVVISQMPWRDLVRPTYAWILTFDMSSLLSVALGLLMLAIAVPLYWLSAKN
jgi:hypothetical protein